MLQRPKNFIENPGEMLQRSDISKSVCHFDPFHQRISVFNGIKGKTFFGSTGNQNIYAVFSSIEPS